MENLFGNIVDSSFDNAEEAPRVSHDYSDEEIARIIEEDHRKRVEQYFETFDDPLFLPPERRKRKVSKRRKPEWQEFGDPRCFEGRYIPKKNLEGFLQSNPSWSQKRLADEVGTDAGTVSKWLSGKKYLSDRKLVQVAHVTGLSLAYLLDLTHVWTDVDALEEGFGYSYEGEDIYRLGDPYAPHEIDGFAGDSLQLRYEITGEVGRGGGKALCEQVLEIEKSEWYNDDDIAESDLPDYLEMRPWIVWHLRGDARDPMHLESELNKYLMDLPDEYDEDGYFLAANQTSLDAYEALATTLHNSANLNKA